jgi:hypothetical protein
MPSPRERAAYHEAGHIIIAAVLGLKLKPGGIVITDDLGKGAAFYETRWPETKYGDNPEFHERFAKKIDRKNSILAAFAGQIAQEKFDLNSPAYDADDLEKIIEPLLQEEREEQPVSHDICEELRAESDRLVIKHWKVIAEIAKKVLAKKEDNFESRLSRDEIVPILKKYGIDPEIANPAAD